MPDPVAAIVVLSSAFAIYAGLKAAWHNVQLRDGGERPLGIFANLIDRKGK